MGLSELWELDYKLAAIVMPYITILVAIGLGKFMLSVVDNYIAGWRFRARGFRVGDTVEVEGDHGTIVKIGAWDSDFHLITSHSDRNEYLSVPNIRLPYIKIKRLCGGKLGKGE